MNSENNIYGQYNGQHSYNTITPSAVNQYEKKLTRVDASQSRGRFIRMNQHPYPKCGDKDSSRHLCHNKQPLFSSDSPQELNAFGRRLQSITNQNAMSMLGERTFSILPVSIIETDFHRAVELSDYQLIAKLIAYKPEGINSKNRHGETPLSRAVYLGDDKAVEEILKCKATMINAVDQYGNSPLHIAINRGLEKITTQLLDCNVDIKIKNAYGFNALHIAAFYGFTILADKILKKMSLYESWDAISIINEEEDKHRSTPLQIAVNFRHTPMVRKLLACQHIDINKYDDLGWSALHVAVQRGHKEIVELLIACGEKLDVNAFDSNGFTALHRAVARDDAAIVEILLSHPAINITLVSPNGQTVLMMAERIHSLGLIASSDDCGISLGH